MKEIAILAAILRQETLKAIAFVLLPVTIVFSIQANAGSSSVVYPKLKNNGTTWFSPSLSLKSYYANYFIDMDRTYKQQVIADKRFSDSLLNLCGETSALFYRYLKNHTEKPLFNDGIIKTTASLQKKEGLPFIGTDSQYYRNDMHVEFPRATNDGKYQSQFVYEYNTNSSKHSIYQLNKNLGGGNGKNKELVFISFLSIYYIDTNGNKSKPASKNPFYVILKIDSLQEINKASSESDAFTNGKKSCGWMSTRLTVNSGN